MTRQEWYKSTHNLRELLKELDENGSNRMVKYKFGLEFNPTFQYYHLWNGLAKNTMATVRILSDRVVVRYRPNSHYKYELLKMKFGKKKMVFIPSETLSRHRAWVRNRIQSRIERVLQEEGQVQQDFLDQMGSMSPQTTTNGYRSTPHPPQETTGSSSAGNYQWVYSTTRQTQDGMEIVSRTVIFDSAEQYRVENHGVMAILNELRCMDVDVPSPISLVDLYALLDTIFQPGRVLAYSGTELTEDAIAQSRAPIYYPAETRRQALRSTFRPPRPF